MRSIATVKTTKTNEYQKLVSVGGTTVNRGTEGEARTETSTPKMERVDIKLNPIYAYPKTTQEILDFSEVDILGWLSSEIADTFTATEESDFVNGDGDKKSKGFLSYPAVQAESQIPQKRRMGDELQHRRYAAKAEKRQRGLHLARSSGCRFSRYAAGPSCSVSGNHAGCGGR